MIKKINRFSRSENVCNTNRITHGECRNKIEKAISHSVFISFGVIVVVVVVISSFRFVRIDRNDKNWKHFNWSSVDGGVATSIEQKNVRTQRQLLLLTIFKVKCCVCECFFCASSPSFISFSSSSVSYDGGSCRGQIVCDSWASKNEKFTCVPCNYSAFQWMRVYFLSLIQTPSLSKELLIYLLCQRFTHHSMASIGSGFKYDLQFAVSFCGIVSCFRFYFRRKCLLVEFPTETRKDKRNTKARRKMATENTSRSCIIIFGLLIPLYASVNVSDSVFGRPFVVFCQFFSQWIFLSLMEDQIV